MAQPLEWRLASGAILPVHLGLDALSAFFLLAVLLLATLSAVYGVGYLGGDRTKQRAAVSWAFFNLLVLSMALVVLARHAFLFLLAWETMALASFFLVVYHHEKAEVRQASWTYLVATHLGSLCLPPMFFLLASRSSLDFEALGLGLSPEAASVCFLLALVGFGTKAGLMPFHVWLPEAHPAAPSHVSALMSGVMIKTGIYGLVRVLTLLGEPPLWWGWLLLALGGASGVPGRALRAGAARPQAAARLPQHREHRDHPAGPGRGRRRARVAARRWSRPSASRAPSCTCSTTRSSRACSSWAPAR